MAKIVLTDLSINRLAYDEKTITYFDKNLSGFGIRIGKKRKTFILMQGDKREVVTLGHYPSLPLKDARRLAITRGASTSTISNKTRENAVLSFLDDCTGRLKTATINQYRQYLDICKPDLNDLTRAHVSAMLANFTSKPFAQNYAYATLRAFFNWCLDHEIIETHPLMRGRLPNKTRSRDRVLSDEELGRIWRHTKDDTYGRIMRLLILTGQRRMEVRNLKPEDVADGLVTFHTKGDKINIIPVTPIVQENLILPFTFNNWSSAKAKFDNDCGVDFRHHDLRRTLATKLASFGVPIVVIERILGHTFGGVKAVYNRHTYLPEVTNALLTYEAHIRKIALL